MSNIIIWLAIESFFLGWLLDARRRRQVHVSDLNFGAYVNEVQRQAISGFFSSFGNIDAEQNEGNGFSSTFI